MAITFETFQQLYYINRFDLAKDVSFFDILQSQAYRWVIWMSLGFTLLLYARKEATHYSYNFKYFLKYGLFILLLVGVNILIISTIQIFLNEDGFLIQKWFQEYIPFYIFQKAPIYILGYSAVAIILHLYFANEKLQFQVQKLSELKEINLNLYNKLKAEISDKTTILNIKIGNRRRIIPVAEIQWIEADDYCAKVHLINGKSYSMRSTLKTLEGKLQPPFLRVHRKAIVNMEMVKELNTINAPCIILNNNREVPVSKSNLKMVKDFIS
jgi:hypothetical protein